MPSRDDVLRWQRSSRRYVLRMLRRFVRLLPFLLATISLPLIAWQVLPHFWNEAPAAMGKVPAGVAGAVWALTLFALWLAGRDRAWRALRAGGAFCLILLLAGALGYAITGWVGGRLERGPPLEPGELWLGLGVGTVLVLATLTLAGTVAWRLHAGQPRFVRVALVVLAAQSLTLGWLTARDPRWQAGSAGDEQRARGRIDLLLALDPDDPTARALIAQADARRDLIVAPPADTARFDIGLGVATLDRPVLQPTIRRARYAEALAALGKPDAADEEAASIRWRFGARPALVFVTSRQPGKTPLVAGLSQDVPVYYLSTGRAAEEAVRSWEELATRTGGRVIDPSAYDRPTLAQAVEDAVTDAPLAAARRLAYRYRVHLRFNDGERSEPLDVEQLLRPTAGVPEADEICERRDWEVDDCIDIASPIRLLGTRDDFIDFEGDARKGFMKAAEGVAPRMYFHIRRQGRRLHIGYWWFFPVNISPVQSQRTCIPGLTVREVTCYDHEGDWEGVTVTLGLPDDVGGPPADPYLPSAYDARLWRPVSVSYDAHGRSIRWPWRLLSAAGAVERDTHLQVFVARGSHASYPLACKGGCEQGLALKPDLPEGPYGGQRDWIMDHLEGDRDRCELESCLMPLPVLRDVVLSSGQPRRIDQPALWNDFSGRWGASVCIPVGQVCSQSDGPRSPSRQRRYRAPWRASRPREETRRIFAKHRQATH